MKGRYICICGSGDTGTGMLAQQGVLHHLSNVSVYDSAYDCLYEEGFLPSETAIEEEDFHHFLRHVDDWESIRLIVMNGEIVLFCDSLNGDVGSFCTLSEFAKQMKEAYEQDKEN